MWKEIPNSPLISIERKSKGLIGYAVECVRPDGAIEARACVYSLKTKMFLHVFTGMKNLDEACSAVEIAMKINRQFFDEN
jgi:hypothetical protein